MIDSGIEIKGPSLDIQSDKTRSLNRNKKMDIDIQSPKGNISLAKELNFEVDKKNKGYLIKFPRMNDSKTLSGSADLKGKIPSPMKFEKDIDKNTKTGEIDIGINGGRKVELKEGKLNVSEIKGGGEGERFKIGMPSLPKVNLKGKGIKADGDIDVDLPEGDINVKAEAPDVDIKAPKGSGGFHIGLPKFGIKGKGEKGEFELPEANVNVDANVPDVDLKAPKGGFNVNLPSFGIKGKGPKAEVELPDANVNVDASLPDADLDVKGSKGKSFFTQHFLKIIKLLILSFDF